MFLLLPMIIPYEFFRSGLQIIGLAVVVVELELPLFGFGVVVHLIAAVKSAAFVAFVGLTYLQTKPVVYLPNHVGFLVPIFSNLVLAVSTLHLSLLLILKMQLSQSHYCVFYFSELQQIHYLNVYESVEMSLDFL